MKISALLIRLTTIASFILPFAANAYVECNVKPQKYYVGDEGFLWVNWEEGGSGIIPRTDVDFNPTVATVIVGMVSSRSMTVRYSDGTSCTATAAPIIGLWLK